MSFNLAHNFPHIQNAAMHPSLTNVSQIKNNKKRPVIITWTVSTINSQSVTILLSQLNNLVTSFTMLFYSMLLQQQQSIPYTRICSRSCKFKQAFHHIQQYSLVKLTEELDVICFYTDARKCGLCFETIQQKRSSSRLDLVQRQKDLSRSDNPLHSILYTSNK